MTSGSSRPHPTSAVCVFQQHADGVDHRRAATGARRWPPGRCGCGLCRRLPASPTSCVRRASMFRCTSSSPASTRTHLIRFLLVICAMPRWMDAWSSALMITLGQPASRHGPASDVGSPKALVKNTLAVRRLTSSAHGLGEQADQFGIWCVELAGGRGGVWSGPVSANNAACVRCGVFSGFQHENLRILSTQQFPSELAEEWVI